MLGLLLLALVLWIALGLDRCRRYRLHDQGPDVAGHHRHRAVPHHRHLRRNGVIPAPLIRGWSRAMAQHEERSRQRVRVLPCPRPRTSAPRHLLAGGFPGLRAIRQKITVMFAEDDNTRAQQMRAGDLDATGRSWTSALALGWGDDVSGPACRAGDLPA